MSINTNLDLPSFNVIKYIIVFVIFDVAIRRSLASIFVFFRRLSLRNGCSVSLHSGQVDRYNLQAHFFSLKSLASLFLFFLTLSVYAVEFFLEFSSESTTRKVAVPKYLTVFNATGRACDISDVTYNRASVLMIRLATECIDIDYEERLYRFYNYTWTRTSAGAKDIICVRMDDNLLVKGSLVYGKENIDPSDGQQLVRAIRGASSGANGDQNQAFVTINVKNEDVFANYRQPESGFQYVAGLFSVLLIENSTMTIKCYGNVFGRLGEGQMKAEVQLCLSSDFQFAFMAGSGLIKEDARYMKGNSSWVTPVACVIGNVINDFEARSERIFGFRKEARALFLASIYNPDERSLQRLAALYENCEKVMVPVADIYSNQTVPRAEVFSSTQVIVQEWAIVLVAACPVLLISLSSTLTAFGNHMKMPKEVHGENAIAARWIRDLKGKCHHATEEPSQYCDNLQSNDSSISSLNRSRPLYLSVDVGCDRDDLTVTPETTTVKRDKLKPFADVES